MDAFRLGFWALHVFNTWLPHGKKHPCYVYGNHPLVENIVILCKKSYLCLLGYYVGQERRDYALDLEQVEIISLVECSSCLLAIQHVPLPMQCSVVSIIIWLIMPCSYIDGLPVPIDGLNINTCALIFKTLTRNVCQTIAWT